MNRVSTATFDSTVQVERQEKSAARAVVLALLTAVVVVDQTAKWWGWRHAAWAQINYGGNSLVEPPSAAGTPIPSPVGCWTCWTSGC
jgi:hypothetical protein